MLGHLWTLLPTLAEPLRPARPPAGSVPWTAQVEDPETGRITLRGWLHDPGSSTLVVLIHGIASSPDARYVKESASLLAARGLATLRLGMRGTDREGADIYHAGMTADLRAAVASLPAYERVVLVGFSLGGAHCANLLTEEGLDPRIVGAGAICPPLDLARVQAHLDAPERWFYRRHVLSGLKETHAALRARLGLGKPWLEDPSDVRSMREWDARVVVPRFGFSDVEDYYRRASLAGRVEALRRPLVIAAAPRDPMIPWDSFEALFPGGGGQERRQGRALLLTARGGHVYLPRREGRSVVEQVVERLGV